MEFDSIVNHNLERGNQSVAGNLDSSVRLMVDDSEHRKADRRKADLALQESAERYRYNLSFTKANLMAGSAHALAA